MKPTIYISGGFYGVYKQAIQERLGPHLILIDPETSPDMGIPARYVAADLNAIESSRIVLAVQTDYPYLDGLAAEVGYAAGFVRGIAYFGSRPRPIKIDTIYVCLRKRQCAFLAALARATFSDLGAACDFIIQRYSQTPEPTTLTEADCKEAIESRAEERS